MEYCTLSYQVKILHEILEQANLVGEPYFMVPCVGGITVCGISIKENYESKN